ncbi:hypothetical protein L1765_14615 [Microaerobacter geothermalis]|uniref:hypothetical protein n=1 Tax=Microaerobacter geothermalis TaxID=674972 RepID=UPI001F1B4406|nr:hypothetical protein [Microaerobacter geothermalis]MCF6095194.1 hypothetical protein [Microaerobacter geothermalis]
MKMKGILFSIVFIFAIIVLSYSLLQPSPVQENFDQNKIPYKLGDFSLVNKIEGPQAMEQIRYLHGKEIPIDNAFILEYQGRNGHATVWISESNEEGNAEKLFRRMNGLMDNSKVYTNHKEITIDGITLQYVYGMEMDNYYYFSGNQVIWISLVGDKENLFLKDAIKWF